MPILTRSRARQLKRDRDEMEKEDKSIKSIEEQPKKKKRKLNAKKSEDSSDTKNKKKKKKEKVKKSKEENKESDLHSDETKEINRLKQHHRKLLADGYRCVVGVDEAGRGPLAGPVVIGCAYVPIEVEIAGIADSKKINDEAEREKLYEIITSTKEIKWSVAILDHAAIDEFNILEASMIGMRQSVKTLHDEMVKSGLSGIDYALCDGNRDPWQYAECVYPAHLKYEYVTKGDGNIYCVGAASIIAKVTRDRIMNKYDAQYPIYGFLQHKGYPTPSHKATVLSKGPCPIHRKSFRPVSTWYKQNDPQTHEKWEKLKKQRAEERKKLYAEKQKKTKSGKGKKGQKSIKGFFKKKKKQFMVEEEEQKDLESDME